MGRGALAIACWVAGCNWLTGDAPEPRSWMVDLDFMQEADWPATEQPASEEVDDAPLVALRRAEKPLWFPAKGATNLGFKLDALSRLHALEGTVVVPQWSAPGRGEPDDVRDDDLDTTWACDTAGEPTCVIGLELPARATVQAVRIHVGKNADPVAYARSARPKRVRVHTEQGYADALVPDEQTGLYVILGEAVKTSHVELEVLETWEAKGDAKDRTVLHVGELEVYGEGGVARAPLQLDPEQTWIAFAGPPWTRIGDGWELARSYVHASDPDGRSRRLFDGTALLGQTGDRIVLLERMERATCDGSQGTYALLDLKTRVLAPLGRLGGMDGTVFRHAGGLGLAVGHGDAYTTTLAGAVIENGAYTRKRTPVRVDRRTNDPFAAWGLDPRPLPRGGHPLDADLPGCEPGTDAMLASLDHALRAEMNAAPDTWTVCTLDDGAVAWLGSARPCSGRTAIHVVDRRGRRVATRRIAGDGGHPWIRRTAAGLLVEVEGAGGTHRVHRVWSGGITPLPEHSALAARPPPRCRQPCKPRFPDPG